MEDHSKDQTMGWFLWFLKSAYRPVAWGVKQYYGTVTITHPQNRTVVKPGDVEITGSHTNPKIGRYWLAVTAGHHFWINTRIELHDDGRWNHSMHVGTDTMQRIVTVSVIWVPLSVDALLLEIQERNNKLKSWPPLNVRPDGSFKVVQSIVLDVRPA